MTDEQRDVDSANKGVRGRIRDLSRQIRDLLSRNQGKATLFFIGLVMLVGFLLNSARAAAPVILTPKDVKQLAAETMASATPPPAISALIYEAILPSLVLIQTEFEDEGESNFLLGGGVIINDEALILTSLHIVAGAREIQVTYADGTTSLAIISDQQTEMDVAVLTPDTPPSIIVPAVIGRSSSIRIGDETFAVGNPLGLMGSMTAGVISGLDRSFRLRGADQPLEGLIQFDAAVNLGNSGGPLLNRDGQLIGIVTGLLSPTEEEAFIGIGFAVPIDVAASAAGSPPY
jgi:S1-C subfamily serine protease